MIPQSMPWWARLASYNAICGHLILVRTETQSIDIKRRIESTGSCAISRMRRKDQKRINMLCDAMAMCVVWPNKTLLIHPTPPSAPSIFRWTEMLVTTMDWIQWKTNSTLHSACDFTMWNTTMAVLNQKRWTDFSPAKRCKTSTGSWMCHNLLERFGRISKSSDASRVWSP